MRRSLLLSSAVLASALVLGCTDQSNPTEAGADPTALKEPGAPMAAARATLHFRIEQPVELAFTSPCTGGLVEGTGTVVGQVNVAGELVDGVLLGLHVEVSGPTSGTLTDQLTGTTYTWHDTFHSVFNSPSGPALNFTTTSPGNLIAFPTEGSGAAIRLHTLLHTTVGPNGVVRATIEIVDIRCLG